MKNWKKNVLAAGVLVAVCAGIYLNWRYSSDQQKTANLTDTLDSGKLLSDDSLVLATEASPLTQTGPDTVTDYFAAVRLSRQEARDSAVNLLQQAMAYDTDSAAEQTAGQLDQLVQTGLQEAQIESLVIAKGYTDCVAYMSDDGISVAVAAPEGGLEQEDVAVIADIVMSQSGYGMEEIRVVEVQ